MIIAPAGTADLQALCTLWNPFIRDTTITFSSEEKTPDALAQMIATRRANGHEFLVARAGDRLLGFATYAQFRAGNGYAHAMEHTIVLSRDAQGRASGAPSWPGLRRMRGPRAHIRFLRACRAKTQMALPFTRRLAFALWPPCRRRAASSAAGLT